MLSELSNKLEKQAQQLELLEEELKSVQEALEERTLFAANLERDLEHLIVRLQHSGQSITF